MKTPRWNLLTNNQRDEVLNLLRSVPNELYSAAEAAREILEASIPIDGNGLTAEDRGAA